MDEGKFKTDFEKFSYALGMSISGSLKKSGVKKIDVDSFLLGLTDLLNDKTPRLNTDEANMILDDHIVKASESKNTRNLEEGLTFLAENNLKEEVIELSSGLQYMVIKKGKGKLAKLTDKVRCHYHGTLINGSVFDSSVERGQPAEFPVNGVIKGWTEALQLMPAGSKWRLFIPPFLGYGDRGAGNVIGPNTTLIFDVELLEIL
jgi:FKBP-type peptidyl-prolyl cis-trans isomerase FklB